MENNTNNYLSNHGLFDDLDLGEKEKDIKIEPEDEKEKSDAQLDESEDLSKENKAEGIIVSKSKILLIKKMILNLKETSSNLDSILQRILPPEEFDNLAISQIGEEEIAIEGEADAKIIEGVFDGEKMIGPDGKQYSVPANYASKSKLVEGDMMKLTITDRGSFVYKQIGPIERAREVGILEKTHEGNYLVSLDNKKWQILPASVTYFKGLPGDEVIFLIPKTGESRWAAVENIIKPKE